MTPEPTSGICYGCRHVGDPRFSTSGHCRGSGSLDPLVDRRTTWPGFACVCDCVFQPAPPGEAR